MRLSTATVSALAVFTLSPLVLGFESAPGIENQGGGVIAFDSLSPVTTSDPARTPDPTSDPPTTTSDPPTGVPPPGTGTPPTPVPPPTTTFDPPTGLPPPPPPPITSTPVTSVSAPTETTVWKYGMCGGLGYTGSTICIDGTTCTVLNQFFSQCL
ncbi:hypothetical protein EIP91_000499 [Steccherinum ochraceum]|uniref:CBM1 domain-containing protein n=1 Tax=Steccherinum ochraceum TaxID=92696 RepID=A0A4R0RQG4_9APHY|nr:hypothetical protein EIP91_000499 [Steccherinum ochraceum]